MKKLLSLILALLIVASLLTGCTSGLNEDDGLGEDETEESTPEPTAEPTEPVDVEKEQRQLFYDYLGSTLIPQIGLADLSAISWTHASARGGVDSNPLHLIDNGRGGLLSAVVRDFDLDGNQDMVTFCMDVLPYNETWSAIYSSTNPVYNISMSLYKLDGETVVHSDTYHSLMHLDGSSWGHISIRMELMEEGIFLCSHSYAEDYSTYGESPTSVFHVADGKFVFDYISSIHYGQSSIDTNPNILMNTTDLEYLDYTISTMPKAAAETDPHGDPEENRWIYFGSFELTDWSESTMCYTGTDYTGLRIILEQGIDSFPHEPLPQGGLKPEDPSVQLALELAQPIADYIAEQTGCVFIDTDTSYSEYSNTASVNFETEEYTFLSVTYDAATQQISFVALSTNDYPVPQEWFDMKDALLQYPEFGLLSGELAPFLGKKFSYTNHMNGTAITGATVSILQITDTRITIRFT